MSLSCFKNSFLVYKKNIYKVRENIKSKDRFRDFENDYCDCSRNDKPFYHIDQFNSVGCVT